MKRYWVYMSNENLKLHYKLNYKLLEHLMKVWIENQNQKIFHKLKKNFFAQNISINSILGVKT